MLIWCSSTAFVTT